MPSPRRCRPLIPLQAAAFLLVPLGRPLKFALTGETNGRWPFYRSLYLFDGPEQPPDAFSETSSPSRHTPTSSFKWALRYKDVLTFSNLLAALVCGISPQLTVPFPFSLRRLK